VSGRPSHEGSTPCIDNPEPSEAEKLGATTVGGGANGGYVNEPEPTEKSRVSARAANDKVIAKSTASNDRFIKVLTSEAERLTLESSAVNTGNTVFGLATKPRLHTLTVLDAASPRFALARERTLALSALGLNLFRFCYGIRTERVRALIVML
jgi:hypothetical protein